MFAQLSKELETSTILQSNPVQVSLQRPISNGCCRSQLTNSLVSFFEYMYMYVYYLSVNQGPTVELAYYTKHAGML